jgi:hypothetical protein
LGRTGGYFILRLCREDLLVGDLGAEQGVLGFELDVRGLGLGRGEAVRCVERATCIGDIRGRNAGTRGMLHLRDHGPRRFQRLIAWRGGAARTQDRSDGQTHDNSVARLHTLDLIHASDNCVQAQRCVGVARSVS